MANVEITFQNKGCNPIIFIYCKKAAMQLIRYKLPLLFYLLSCMFANDHER